MLRIEDGHSLLHYHSGICTAVTWHKSRSHSYRYCAEQIILEHDSVCTNGLLLWNHELFLFLRMINDKWLLWKRHYMLKKTNVGNHNNLLSVKYNIFRVLEINYCLLRELYLGIVIPSSSHSVLSLFICISVCEFYGRWTFLKIFRNRDSKVSLTLITVSVFMCLCHWSFHPWGLYSCTANYLESVLWIITTCHRCATLWLCNY